MKEINLKKAMNALTAAQLADRWMKPEMLKLVSDREKARCEIEQAETHKAYEEARADLKKAIDEIQTKCTARTISSHEVCKALQKIEAELAISKKAMDGISVAVDLNANNFPGTYTKKGIPMSTIFEARYKSGSWRITDIYRAETRRWSKGCTVNLTEEAKAAIVARFESLTI